MFAKPPRSVNTKLEMVVEDVVFGIEKSRVRFVSTHCVSGITKSMSSDQVLPYGCDGDAL